MPRALRCVAVLAASALVVLLAAASAAAEVVTKIRSRERWEIWDAAHPLAAARRRVLFVDEAYPQSLRKVRVAEAEPDDPFGVTAAVYLGADLELDALFPHQAPGTETTAGRSARRRLGDPRGGEPDIRPWSRGESHRLGDSLLAVVSRVTPEEARRWAAAAAAESPLPVRYCVLGDGSGCAEEATRPLGFRPHHEEQLLLRVRYSDGALMPIPRATFSDEASAREAARELSAEFTD